MANPVTLTARVFQRNDTAAGWTAANPVLGKGEIGIEIDTLKAKVGDGITAWKSLSYAWLTAGEAGALGGGDMLKSEFAANGATGKVDKAVTADKLSASRTIGLSGDMTGSAGFDGSGDITLAAALQSVVAAGTYVKVTVNAKGLVTGFQTLAATDIPSLTLSKITDAGTAAAKNAGTAAGNVLLIGSDGKIDNAVIPAIALVDTSVVANEAAMLALNAQQGDIAIRTDVSKTFILTQSPAGTLANWRELLVPAGGIQSVNGKNGTSVTITTDDVGEGAANLYFTSARATANFNTNFPGKASTDLSDGASLLHSTDTLVLNGGNAALS